MGEGAFGNGEGANARNIVSYEDHYQRNRQVSSIVEDRYRPVTNYKLHLTVVGDLLIRLQGTTDAPHRPSSASWVAGYEGRTVPRVSAKPAGRRKMQEVPWSPTLEEGWVPPCLYLKYNILTGHSPSLKF